MIKNKVNDMEITSFRQYQNGAWIQDPAYRVIAAPSATTKCSNRYRYLTNPDENDDRSLIEFSLYLSMDDFFY